MRRWVGFVASISILALPAGVVKAQSSGTGFFVGPDGFVVTSHHVVDGADQITCRTADGSNLPAELIHHSQGTDLAILRVPRRPTNFLVLAPAGTLELGQRIFTIGYPVTNILGTEPRYTDGTVSALALAGDSTFVQISIPVQPGNSGGPIVNERGQVVGVVASTAQFQSFLRQSGALPQNISFGIKAEFVRALLGSENSPSRILSGSDSIRVVRDALCLISATSRRPQVAAPASAQPDTSANPNFGTINLSVGFNNDPRVIRVVSGGPIAASSVGRDCAGYVSREPDVRLNYTAGRLPLIISAASRDDTTLIVNAPDGRWYCDDDGGVNGLNPSVRFNSPQSGRYEIWVGSYQQGQNSEARLHISELRSQ